MQSIGALAWTPSIINGMVAQAQDAVAEPQKVYAELNLAIDKWDFHGFGDISSGTANPGGEALANNVLKAVAERPTWMKQLNAAQKEVTANAPSFGKSMASTLADDSVAALNLLSPEIHKAAVLVASAYLASGVLNLTAAELSTGVNQFRFRSAQGEAG